VDFTCIFVVSLIGFSGYILPVLGNGLLTISVRQAAIAATGCVTFD